MNPFRISFDSARWPAVALVASALASTAAAQLGDTGLSAVRAQRFVNPDLLFYDPAPGDRFASALAAGDFNGDGADDLASGIPFDDGITGLEIVDAGGVVVRYGIPGRGLNVGGAAFLTQTPNPDPAEAGDWYGFALAACDFNGDSFDDLAVGVVLEDHLGQTDAGGVQIHYGTAGGLPSVGDTFYTQSTPGIPGDVENGDQFGRALACGDFDADGFDDLAIGVPCEDLGGAACGGMVDIVPGSAFGLDPAAATSFDQELAAIEDDAEDQDLFGFALAAGDFDGDGFADLVIGVPGESAIGAHFGVVNVIFGGSSGLTATGSLYFDESDLGGVAEENDNLGYSLGAGDFDGDGFDDIVIGIPFEDFGAGGSIVDAGRVAVVYGSAIGPLAEFTQFWSQDDVAGPGTTEANDQFGYGMAAGDFDGDGRDDLAVGSPGEFVLVPEDGTTVVWMGSGTGLTAARRRSIATGFDGFPGPANEPGRRFGEALAAGDFDGDGHVDLAIGAPWEGEGALGDIGAEMVLYGSLFADGFGTGTTEPWSSAVCLGEQGGCQRPATTEPWSLALP